MSLLRSYEPRQRLSAAAALAHPWFGVVTPTAVISSTVASLGKVVSTVSAAKFSAASPFHVESDAA